MSLNPEHNGGNRQHREVVHDSFLITGRNAPILFQSIERAFDPITFSVGLTVKACPLAKFIGTAGNDRTNPSSSQILAVRLAGVPFIPGNSLWTDAGTSRPSLFDGSLLHQSLKHYGLMALSDGQQERHRFATVFTTEMDFRTEAPLAVAQGGFLGLTTDDSGRMLMRPNHTAINKVKLSAKLACGIGLLLQLLQNLLPKLPFSPGVKSP